MAAVLDFTLAREFIDEGAERALLGSLAANPNLYWELQDHLPDGTFLQEAKSWKQLSQAIQEDRSFSNPFAEASAEDPLATAKCLEDLFQRRQLAGLQEQLGRALFGQTPAQKVLDEVEETTAGIRQNWKVLISGGLNWGHQLASQVIEMAKERSSQRLETGKPTCGIPSGLATLDLALNGLNPGLHVLAGAPGAGKTTLSLQMALHAAKEGFPVLYVSYENSPMNLIAKSLCSRAGCTTNDLDRGFASVAKLEASAKEMTEWLERLAVVEGSCQLTVAQVRGRALQMLARHSASRCLIIFDYLQRAAHGGAYEQVRQNVSALAGELRDLSNRLNSPVLALSSQNRSAGGYGSGLGSAALDSLKESGDLEYSADTVWFLKRTDRMVPEPARAVDLVVAKNRYGPSDFSIPLIFRPDRGQLREVAP
jgi:replicative DNA helicase